MKTASNRRNALQSTGPKTEEGVSGCKNNALRHGLRAVQTVVPGEDPQEWEAHRDAVVADLRPEGVVEFALAEDVAVKLWRLGRVVRFEADLIANAQDPDELANSHEKAHKRIGSCAGPARSDIPTRADVKSAKDDFGKKQEKVKELARALSALDALVGMADDDRLEDWSIYEPMKTTLDLNEKQIDSIFKDDDAPFVARDVRAMLQKRGTVDEITEFVANLWRNGAIPALQAKAEKAAKSYRGLLRRYNAALARRRRAHGIPKPNDLDRVQRYEAHLERGLHKALDRLRDLQEGRGAVAPRGPSVAVFQEGRGEPFEVGLAPFGKNALDVPTVTQ